MQAATLSTSATVKDLATAYLHHMTIQADMAQITLKYFQGTKRYIVQFARAMGPMRAATAITKQEVREYIHGIAGAVSNRNANTHIVAIRAMVEWAYREHDFPRDWLRLPPKLKLRGPVQREPYTREEFNMMRAVSEGSDLNMLDVFVGTGARKGEIFGLTWPDVNFAANTISLVTGKRKGGRERDTLPMAERLRDAMERQFTLTGEAGGHVFLNPHSGKPMRSDTKWLLRREALAGIEHIKQRGFHGFRRLAALLAEAEASGAAYKMLRHRSKATTGKYLEKLGGVVPMPDTIGSALEQAQA